MYCLNLTFVIVVAVELEPAHIFESYPIACTHWTKISSMTVQTLASMSSNGYYEQDQKYEILDVHNEQLFL